MKRLFAIVVGVAVLALVASFPHAQDGFARPEKTGGDQKKEVLEVVDAVLTTLDDSETTIKPQQNRGADRREAADETSGQPAARAASGRESWVTSLADAVDPGSEVQRVRDDFRRQDQKAAELARQFQQAQKAAAAKGLSSLEDPACRKLKVDLEKAVQAAFDARQKVQWYEVERLRQRLARIESRLTLRERAEGEIVRQRIEELLHPERNWEPEDEARDPLSAADPAAHAKNDSDSSPLDAGAKAALDPWRTDFGAAKAEAAKTGRPLLLYFRPKPSASRRKQEVEMAGSPSVQKVLRHFVLVAIDTSDAANRELMEEYRIADRPKIVVTDGGGQPEYMTEKDAFRDRWNMDTLRQDLTGLVQRYLAEQARPAEAETSQPDTASRASRMDPNRAPASLPDGVTDPRNALLDAEGAVTAARGAIASGEKRLEISKSNAQRAHEAYQKGIATQTDSLAADKQLADDEARLATEKLNLQLARRQVKLARENLNTRMKLLGLDMADAELRVAHLAEEEARARRVFDSKAMSQAEYDEKKLALEQARIQLRRISELMQLYTKPIPGDEPPTADDNTRETPDPRTKKDGEGTSARK